MQEIFRRVLFAIFIITITVLNPSSLIAIQETEEASERALEDWQIVEIQSLVENVGGIVRGELTLEENSLSLQTHFLKGTEGLTYVPFMLSIDAETVSASTIAVYLFVTNHQDPVDTPTDSDDQTEDPPQAPSAVFEDAYFIDISTELASDASNIQLTRAFNAPSGEYDVYIGVRESFGAESQNDQEEPSNSILKAEVSVPDLWTTEVQTSSVLLASSIEAIPAPLSPIEQSEQPYTLGTTKIIPKSDTSFGKQEEMSLLMLVYNPALNNDGKPDVTVEFDFYASSESGEEFFNKTNPQQFNAQTLPPGFDIALGHQIVAGQSIPLSLFPAGNYRLEINISDNEAESELMREVNFTVRET